MVSSGMLAAGYTYVVLDDAWMMRERDKNGNLVADPERFPSGMKALGDYLHELGFKFGIYNCAGSKTCAGYPGGMGHEYQDARTYASWGVDYLKYDWCNTGTRNHQEAYTTMRDALYTAGRPIVFSICEWGQSEPWTWASDVGHLWRTTGDIIDCYDCRTQWSQGWKVILDMQMSLAPEGYWDGLSRYAGPDHWNDPDMMEVGNEGLPLEESRAHFSMWCMLAAPLIAGNDIRTMTDEVRDILTNAEAIAINQDPLGKQGFRLYVDSHQEIWTKELSNGEFAVCIMNVTDNEREVHAEWDRMGHVLGWGTKYEVSDIWNNGAAGTTEKSFKGSLKSHDVFLLRLRPIAE